MLIKPEDITYKIYSKLTDFRSGFFILFLVFVIWTAIDPRWQIVVSRELFISTLKAMITILLAIGGITASFVTIAVGLTKNKKRVEVTNLWLELAKYIIYPFAVIVLIGIILFLTQINISIPDTNSSLSLLMFFGFLVANSFFVIIKASEILIDQSWVEEEKFERLKKLFPVSELNKTFKLLRFEQQSGRIYIYDLIRRKRNWIYNWKTFTDLGYPPGSWQEIDLNNVPNEFRDYLDDEDIISPDSNK